MRENLRYPSPYCAKPIPGETAILASFNNCLLNSREPNFIKESGIFAHTNIVALGTWTCQPSLLRTSTKTSLLCL